MICSFLNSVLPSPQLSIPSVTELRSLRPSHHLAVLLPPRVASVTPLTHAHMLTHCSHTGPLCMSNSVVAPLGFLFLSVEQSYGMLWVVCERVPCQHGTQNETDCIDFISYVWMWAIFVWFCFFIVYKCNRGSHMEFLLTVNKHKKILEYQTETLLVSAF